MFDFTPAEWDAVRLSLKVGLVSVVFSLPVGFALAHVLSRREFPGKSLLNAFVHLPLVLPPVVTGFALLLLFGTQGPLGRFLENVFGVTIAFKWTGAALAAAIMGLPLMVRAMKLSIDAVDRRLETAAATLGARPLRVFFTITVPLSLPGIVAGAILSFAKSFGEFGATITFVSNIPGESQTVPSAIYALTQTPDGDAGAYRLTLVSVAVSMTALIASEWMAKRVGRRIGVE